MGRARRIHRRTPRTRDRPLLERARLRPGHQVLELACGAGGLGLAAARRIQPSGRVLVSDVAAEMVTIAEQRLRQVTVARTAVLDLEDIDQPAGRFDAVLRRHGLQFTLDPGRAAAEMHRVLRPGGRLALSVWAAREQNPWLSVVLDVVSAELGRTLPPPGMPGPFTVTDPNELAQILAVGGFGDIDVSDVPVPMTAASFEEWWTRTRALAGPLSSILADLHPQVAESIRRRAVDATRESRTARGMEFPGVALIASATARSRV